MEPRPTNVAVLGSTGSIGASALAVIGASQGRLRAVALSAHSKTELALEQSIRHQPRWLVITDDEAAARQDWSKLPETTELLVGHTALEELVGPQAARQELDFGPSCAARRVVAASMSTAEARASTVSVGATAIANGKKLNGAANGDDADEQIDIVLAAIVGSVGLRSTWAAVQAGRRVAIANKETLVVAGPLVMELAARTGAAILPVDSEHSAVFQCLQAGRRSELRRIILTASGGPFRRHSAADLDRVTVEDALRHPNWNMGPKITIDSATMMNKALEMIEARWLFDLRPDQIDVVVHPQSIVHSMVEFNDGSVIAQLSPPDMKLPIQYALCYPERLAGPAPRLDLGRMLSLDFEPPDEDRFPAVRLGREAARAGGTAGAVFNAANEAAVGRFLAGSLPFAKIVPACKHTLERHTFEAHPSLERLLALDAWAREEVVRWERN
jgi:1-deoxy-D-xylulose-5-phosphate reductoisomerase